MAAAGLLGIAVIQNAAGIRVTASSSDAVMVADPVRKEVKEKESPGAETPVRLLPAFARGFDPYGDRGVTSRAIGLSRNGELSWSTQWYATAEFGNLKDGTGLLMDVGKRVQIARIRLQLAGPRGTDLDLRLGDQPTLTRMHAVAAVSDAGGKIELRVPVPRAARYVLIWFTRLSPSKDPGRVLWWVLALDQDHLARAST